MKKSTLYLSVVCLCAVACTFTFVAVNTSKNNQKRREVIKANEQISQQVLKNNEETAKNTEEINPENKVSEEVSNEIISANVEEKEFVREVYPPIYGGETITPYTDSVLVFNETYDDYRTHNGIDIKAKENTPVMAVKKGIIIKNEYDFEDGYTVEIEHDDGVVSVYKNLESDKIVNVGQVVTAGETIGMVGRSAVSEGHLEPHLHFEIKEDNVEINPEDYVSLSE